MKKLMTFFIGLFAFSSLAACADNDRPIAVTKLPAAAQQFIQKHFSDTKVALAKEERGFFHTTYEVLFANGNKAEFTGSGEWSDLDCKYTAVPAALIPRQIADYVKQTYPGATVLKLERNSYEYEVKLNNRLELTFNSAFQLIDIDD